MSTPTPPRLQMRNITKRFGAVVANDDVSIDLRRGEILGLLGENGAGKSTLMNILYGLYQPNEGSVHMEGREVRIARPADAVAHGIGMVHQHFMLIPALTVTENIVLGAEPRRRAALDYARAERDVADLASRFGLGVDPRARVGDLNVGVQQRVEILRALYRRADVLVLDEPTAVLSPQEAERLFEVLRGFAAEGLSVILITHKLGELLSVSDRIAVMRDGRLISTVTTAETDPQSLARAMVGRPVVLRVERPAQDAGTTLLEVRDLVVARGGSRQVDGVDLRVRAGEIVGLAGVEGNGQVELAEAIAGVGPVTSGSVSIGGADVTGWSARRRFAAGLAYVPEDRQHKGLVQGTTVYENAVLKRQRRAPFVRHGVLRPGAMVRFAGELIGRFSIRPNAPSALMSTFSGGNQQKLVLARELSGAPQVIVAAQPTRGVDVSAIQAIHEQLIDERSQGRAVLLVSQDLDEIKALSDRILVMAGGAIIGELASTEATDERLGLLMAGEAAR